MVFIHIVQTNSKSNICLYGVIHERKSWEHKWNDIIFNDERKFCLWVNDRRRRVREYGTPLVMVWGTICHGVKVESQSSYHFAFVYSLRKRLTLTSLQVNELREGNWPKCLLTNPVTFHF